MPLCPICPYISLTHQLQGRLSSYHLFRHTTFYEVIDVLSCRFVHRHRRKILKTYSESSSPGGFNETSLISLGCLGSQYDS
jgi:hypothetical protein